MRCSEASVWPTNSSLSRLQTQAHCRPRFVMGWRATALPLFREQCHKGCAPWWLRHLCRHAPLPPSAGAPIGSQQLQVHESTVRDGNCGMHAFVIGLVQQAHLHSATPQLPAVTRLRHCKKYAGLGQAWEAGVSWLRQTAARELWGGMEIQRLCKELSGKSFETYIASMRQGGTWADTTFMHAMACLYGVDLSIF